jgi:hypothetical protein
MIYPIFRHTTGITCQEIQSGPCDARPLVHGSQPATVRPWQLPTRSLLRGAERAVRAVRVRSVRLRPGAATERPTPAKGSKG